MIGWGADHRTDALDDRFQFRVGGQECHADGPGLLLGHASKATQDGQELINVLICRDSRADDRWCGEGAGVGRRASSGLLLQAHGADDRVAVV
jgi:hypothetical protein